MKNLLFIFLLLIECSAFGQKIITLAQYKCNNGWIVKQNSSVILGEPTGDNFTYISSKALDVNSKSYLPATYKDSVVNIESIKKYVWDDGLKQVFVIIKAGGDKYYLEVEKAIESGELGYKKGGRGERSMEADLKANPSKYERLVDSIPTKNGKIFFDQIVSANGIQKDELFSLLRQWLVEEFTDTKAVLEINDKERGILTGKGTYKYTESTGLTIQDGYVTFIINIAVKDEKFRYQLYAFSAKGTKDDYFWGTSVNETFDLDSIRDRYYNGSRSDRKQAKKYLLKLAWLANYIDWSISKVGKGDYNDITKF